METERILLRHWQESDAEALFKYASDPDVGPRAGWPAHKSVEESLEIIRTFFHNDTTWAIVLKETGEAIGCIGYYTHETSNIPIGENDCEVGYWIGKPYWNRGICTEKLSRWRLCGKSPVCGPTRAESPASPEPRATPWVPCSHSLRPERAKVEINRSPILLPLQGVGVCTLIPRALPWAGD